MTLRILIPVQPPGTGKSRLSGALSAAERADLSWSMFRQALHAATAAAGAAPCLVISRSDAIKEAALAEGVCVLDEPDGAGLIGALDHARQSVVADGATSVLSLAADLPDVTADDVAALIAAACDAAVVIAPDAAGTGTNALVLTPPDVIPYAYGEGSFERHCALARARGLTLAVVRRPGLMRDIDTPADLARP